MSRELTKSEQSDVPAAERTRGSLTYSPNIDIWESDDKLVLYADLPGVAAEDLDLRFENHELSIVGRVKPRRSAAQSLHSEYGVGDFYRTFTIGEAVDATKITAELVQGVLTLHLPKTEKVKPRRIEVNAN